MMSRLHLRTFVVPGAAALALCAVIGLAGPAAAAPLLPLAKIRVSVMQFQPATGDYKSWDALGGEIVVSPDDAVALPVIGTIPVEGMSTDQLAGEIARRLQERLGLVEAPVASVAVIEYPPIYLVGSVSSPGQYPFRPGMTVLQAVAMAGGQYRSSTDANPAELIKLQADLQGGTADLARSRARIARLKAELSGADHIEFPPELANSDNLAIQEIMQQETTLFEARRNELLRQTTALNDLVTLEKAEVDVLAQKAAALDQQVAQTEKQLEGVKELVGKGIATVSRQTDLERVLAGLRSDRLDNQIATMSARQALNEATRNIAKLEDNNRAEVSDQLGTEEANLAHLQLNLMTTQRLIVQATDAVARSKADEAAAQAGLSFVIVRPKPGGGTDTIEADESTPLAPGDLIKVTLQNPPGLPGDELPPGLLGLAGRPDAGG